MPCHNDGECVSETGQSAFLPTPPLRRQQEQSNRSVMQYNPVPACQQPTRETFSKLNREGRKAHQRPSVKLITYLSFLEPYSWVKPVILASTSRKLGSLLWSIRTSRHMPVSSRAASEQIGQTGHAPAWFGIWPASTSAW